MGSLGVPELIIILIIIILIFGANRLPEIGRGIGKGIRNFKESTRDGQGDALTWPVRGIAPQLQARPASPPPGALPAPDRDTPAAESRTSA